MAKKSLELQQSGDSYVMTQTIAWCTSNGFAVRRVSRYQIKVGPWNCWPDTGGFNRDDMPARQEGVAEFLAALTKWQEAQATIFKTAK